MNTQRALISGAAILAVLLLSPGRVAAVPDSCELPVDLKPIIQKAFPNKKVVSLADLAEDDLKLWEKDHGKSCPGLTQVDFYGDAKPTWAIVVFGDDPKSVNGATAVLVLAHKPAADWKLRTVETGSSIPVVWKEKPGKYTGLYKEKTIQAPYPVIVLCGYESWAILYAWTGTRITKTWLAD